MYIKICPISSVQYGNIPIRDSPYSTPLHGGADADGATEVGGIPYGKFSYWGIGHTGIGYTMSGCIVYMYTSYLFLNIPHSGIELCTLKCVQFSDLCLFDMEMIVIMRVVNVQ